MKEGTVNSKEEGRGNYVHTVITGGNKQGSFRSGGAVQESEKMVSTLDWTRLVAEAHAYQPICTQDLASVVWTWLAQSLQKPAWGQSRLRPERLFCCY